MLQSRWQRHVLLAAGMLCAGPSQSGARGTITGNGAPAQHTPTTAPTAQRQSAVMGAFQQDGFREAGVMGAWDCDLSSTGDCRDIDFADSACGQFLAQRYRQTGESPCLATCNATPPTLNDCVDPIWNHTLCGRIEAELRGNNAVAACSGTEPRNCPAHPSRCVNQVRTQLTTGQQGNTQLFASFPTATVLLPGDGDLGVTSGLEYGYVNVAAQNAVRQVVPVMAFDGTRGRLRTSGNGAFHWSNGVADSTRMMAKNKALSVVFFDQKRQDWADNQQVVESCDEYVYEKFYTLSVFEDLARKKGADYRAIYEVAYGPPASNPPLPHQLGARAAAGGVAFLQKDGVPNGIDVFNGQRLFRPFFPEVKREEDLISGDGGDNLNEVQGVLVRDGDTIQVGSAMYGPFDLVRPVGLNAYALPASVMRTAIENGVHPPETWAWHQQMSNNLANFTDDELYALDSLNDVVAQAVQSVHDLRNQIRAILFPGGFLDVPTWVNNVPFDPSIFEFQQNPTDIWEIQNVLERQRLEFVGVTLAPARVLDSFELDVGQNVQNRMGTPSQSFALGGGNRALIRGSQGPSGPSTGNGLTTTPDAPGEAAVRSLMRELSIAEQRLEDLLNYGRTRGCLSIQPGPCDWSPLRFAERLNRIFLPHRESSFKWCVERTRTNGFGPVANVPADRFRVRLDAAGNYPGINQLTTVDNQPCNGGAYNSSVSQFERYFKCVDQNRADWLRETERYLAGVTNSLKGANVLVDPETGRVNVGQSASDSDGLGDRDLFAVEYEFEAAWNMSGIPDTFTEPNWCSVLPYATANMRVSGYALGERFNLMKANADVGLDPSQPKPRLYVEVFGEELVDDKSSTYPSAERFSVVAEGSKQLMQTFFEASAIIMVGPVPVTISAGLAGFLAAAGTLAAGSPDRDCQSGSQALKVSFGPVAGIQAFASASVDALVVEVGVKIILTLAALSFPWTTEVSLQPGANDVQLNVKNGLSLVLELLRGRMLAFVEVCFIFCESFEVTLFEITPLRFETSLFSTDTQFSLMPLVKYQELRGVAP